MRRIGWIVALISVCAAGASAQAVSVYVTSSSARFSNSPTGIQGQTTSFWTSGVGGGLTFNVVPVGPVRVGVDIRGSTRPGTNGADTAMGGVRLGIKPPLLAIKPYLQASGGYVATRSRALGGGTLENQYVAWEVLGGLDFPLVPFFDLRLIEVGGGNGYRMPGTSGTPNVSLFTVNTGLVFHF
jgi:hypothetical protein